MRNVRNPHAVMRLVSAKVWPRKLPAPIFAADNDSLIRAVSLIHNLPTRDSQPIHASDMTPAQARDVVAYFSARPVASATNPLPAQVAAGRATSTNTEDAK